MTKQVTLPPSLMRAIKLLCTDPETEPVQAYIGAVLISLSHGLWEQQETLDPTSIQIPEEQWHEICQLLMGLKGTAIGKVNHGLDWVNQGPSAFKPEEATQL